MVGAIIARIAGILTFAPGGKMIITSANSEYIVSYVVRGMNGGNMKPKQIKKWRKRLERLDKLFSKEVDNDILDPIAHGGALQGIKLLQDALKIIGEREEEIRNWYDYPFQQARKKKNLF